MNDSATRATLRDVEAFVGGRPSVRFVNWGGTQTLGGYTKAVNAGVRAARHRLRPHMHRRGRPGTACGRAGGGWWAREISSSGGGRRRAGAVGGRARGAGGSGQLGLPGKGLKEMLSPQHIEALSGKHVVAVGAGKDYSCCATEEGEVGTPIAG